MKKMLCFVLCAVMMLTLFTPCFAQEVETIKIKVSNTGSTSDCKRIIARSEDSSFEVTEANQLAGWLINGKMTYTGTGDFSKTVVFKDVEIVKSDVRSGGTFALDFKVPDGYTIRTDNSEDKSMEWDLTITGVKKETVVPEGGAEKTVKVRVSNTGSSGGNKRVIARTDDKSFSVTEMDQLKGWVINGKMTYTGTGDFSKEVIFKDVEIQKSDVRSGGAFAMDFKVPDGYTICVDYSEDKNMVWDLTITGVYNQSSAPENEEEKPVVIPASKFKLKDGEQLMFIKADDFKDDLGRWINKGATSGSVLPILEATPVKTGSDVPANTTVKIEKAGKYYVHVSALDYATNQPATRFFNIAVNDTILPEKAGTHKQDGWRWQLVGDIDLEAGDAKVSVLDTANFFGRFQGIILTTDKDFSGPSDEEMIKISNEYTVGEKIETVVPTNKLGKAVMLFLGSPKAYVMGKETKVDVNNDTVVPFTENDRTLVPVRFIAESFGAKVGWDDATQTVTVEANGKVIKMVLGKAEMDVDGNKVILDTPANTYNDRTFIPLRAMVEAINKNVFWDDRGLIIISDLTFNAETDRELIDNAVAGYGGELIDFAVPDEDLSGFMGTIGESDYMMDYFNPAEFNERNGIVNTINKLRNGEEVTIAFFGGSITEQNGWRPKTLDWIKAQYPDAKIKEIDVSLSGTGADLAACRVETEALVYDPDLIFFEYAVNGGTSENAEGFVRQILKKDPTIDICFVYTLTTDSVNGYKNGIPSNYEKAYELVAEYYGIPSVSFGYQIADLHTQGKLTLKASTPENGKILFSSDGIHPTMDGSILYAGAVARALATMDKHTVTKEFVHDLKEPLFKENWEGAKAYDMSVATFDGEWTELTHNGTDYGEGYPYQGASVSGYYDVFPKLMGSKTPGASFTVKFVGTTIGVFDLGGPYSGQFKVTIDGAEPIILSRHTVYNSHIRNQYIFTPDLPYGEHTVTFTLDSEIPDKSAMSDYAARKAEYDKTEVYLSKILVVGEIK